MKNCNSEDTLVEFGLKLNKDGRGDKVENTLYMQIVGSVMYLATTIPDIMYVVRLIRRHIESPKEIYLLVAKRILRYLQGTKDFDLFYKKGQKSGLVDFPNIDYARDQDEKKSTSSYVFVLGTWAVSWSSKK